MIFDETTILTASVPTVGLPLSLSTSLQLNAGADGLSSLLGDGNPVTVEFEVTTAFATATDAVAQFGVVVSDDVTGSLNALNLGFIGGTVTATGTGLFVAGLTVLDLTLGARFHLTIPPHSRDIRIAGADSIPFDKKWVTFVIFVPNYSDSGSVGFTAGAMKARFCLNPLAEDWNSRHVPPRMIVK
jgi:hypothetical protein